MTATKEYLKSMYEIVLEDNLAVEWSNDSDAFLDKEGDLWYNNHWAREEELVKFVAWIKLFREE